MFGEAFHGPDAAIDVVPPDIVLDRDEELFADGHEEINEVDLLDDHLDIDVLIVPEAEWLVGFVRTIDAAKEARRVLLMIIVIDILHQAERSGALESEFEDRLLNLRAESYYVRRRLEHLQVRLAKIAAEP